MNPLETVLEKVGRVLSDRFGIKVICEGARCCTDGRKIYLPALPDDVPDELRDALRGYLDHECGHVAAASDFGVGAKFKRKHGAVGFGFLNTLEDLRIEEFMKQRYPGSAVNLSNAYRYAVKVTAEKVEAGDVLPPVKQLAFAVCSRVQGQADLPFIDPAAYWLADEIDREIRAAVTAPDTRTVAALAEAAWPVVQAYLNPPTANGDGSDTSGADTSDAATSSASSASQSDPPSAADSPAGSDASTSATDPGHRSCKRKNGKKSENATADSSPSNATGKAGASAGCGSGIGADADDGDAGIIGGLGADLAGAVDRHARIIGAYRPWTTANDTVSVAPDHSATSHAERLAPLMKHVAGVRQRLIQTLMSEVRVRWLPDQEDGGLNPRALHRLAAVRHLRRPTTESHIHTDQVRATVQHPRRSDSDTLTRRIYRKRVAAKRLKTAVTLLVDLSHSMATRKLDIARSTALILCEALSRLGIPVAVWGFSTGHQSKLLRDAAQATGIAADTLEKQYRFAPLIHERFKHFDEPFRKISGRFEQMHTHMLTPLGESMLFAARELGQRPEPRKILLVLTDGRPAVGQDDDAATFRHAKDSVVRIEKAGIEVALVGILESCVRDLHHRSVVVDALENLPGAVMKQLQTLLTRSPRAVCLRAAA